MKILFAIDVLYETENIVNTVKEIAAALAAEVWLLHVTLPDPDFVGFGVGPQSERDFMAKEFHQEHQQIQDIAADFRNAGMTATALLVQGATVETILAKAKKLAVDMIVMGSHGRGRMAQIFVGSTSQGVLHKAECPVLVIPTREPN